MLFILYTQNHQRGKTIGVCFYLLGINAFGGQGFSNETAHMFISNPGQHGRFQTQSSSTNCGIRWATANILGKTAHVLQATTYLLAIQVYPCTADTDEIQISLFHYHSFQLYLSSFIGSFPRRKLIDL